MAQRRRWICQSYSALVLVVLLMTSTGITLVHWHKEWTGQGCELCSVRQQPVLTAPVVSGPEAPVETEFAWHVPNALYEPETLRLSKPSRAPPQFITFTV